MLRGQGLAEGPLLLRDVRLVTFGIHEGISLSLLEKGVPFDHAVIAAVRTEKHVAGAEETTNPAKPLWKVPSEWQEQSPGQINLAKWVVGSDSGGGSAEVTVSAFPGDVGGLLANVNRWRGQVGLGNISQSDLSSHVTPVDVPGGKAMLVDVTGSKNGQKARLIGAIVPREGRTWFFKLMGDEQVAEKQKSVFVKFVQTVQFPDA